MSDNVSEITFKDGRAGGIYSSTAFLICSSKIKSLLYAGVYQSETAGHVQKIFKEYRKTQDYSEAVCSTMSALGLSKSSVTSYLPSLIDILLL